MTTNEDNINISVNPLIENHWLKERLDRLAQGDPTVNEHKEETLKRCKDIYAQVVPNYYFKDWKAFKYYKDKMQEGIPQDAIDFVARIYHYERSKIEGFEVIKEA